MSNKDGSRGERGNTSHHNHLPRPCEITGHLESEGMQFAAWQAHKTEQTQIILFALVCDFNNLLVLITTLLKSVADKMAISGLIVVLGFQVVINVVSSNSDVDILVI